MSHPLPAHEPVRIFLADYAAYKQATDESYFVAAPIEPPPDCIICGAPMGTCVQHYPVT